MIQASQTHVARCETRTVGIPVRTPAKTFIGGRAARDMKNHMLSKIRYIFFFHDIQNRVEDFLLLLDFAIANLPRDEPKTLHSRNGSAPARNPRRANMLKGTAALRSDALRHGQRPKVTAVRSAFRACGHPSPTSLLNHETSDHLLSLR